MLLDQAEDSVDFASVESSATLKPHWFEPEFRDILIAFDMDVGRLATVTCVEKEPVGAGPKNGGHTFSLFVFPRFRLTGK